MPNKIKHTRHSLREQLVSKNWDEARTGEKCSQSMMQVWSQVKEGDGKASHSAVYFSRKLDDRVCVCVLSHSLLQPASFLCPWDSPGKNIWVCLDILFSRRSSGPRVRTQVFCIIGGFFACWITSQDYQGTSQANVAPERNTVSPEMDLRWHLCVQHLAGSNWNHDPAANMMLNFGVWIAEPP